MPETAAPDRGARPRAGLDASSGVLIAEGSEAQVFAFDTHSVFRVSRRGGGGDDRGLTAHVAAWERGAPVPRPYGAARVAGRPGLVMERLDPSHLLHTLSANPWTVMRAGRVMGAVHAALHEVAAPTSLPTMHEVVLSRIACRRLPRHLRHRLEQLVRTLPTGRRLLHGDLNPANLLRRPVTGEWLAVDWSGAARGSPAADVAITLVTIARGAVPAATPRWACVAAPAGRRMLTRAYLNSYRAHRAVDLDAVRRWASVWQILRRTTLDGNREVICAPHRKPDGATTIPTRTESGGLPSAAGRCCASHDSCRRDWP
jgi:streptomycin 6-kinase